jgi:hypothetical protein
LQKFDKTFKIQQTLFMTTSEQIEFEPLDLFTADYWGAAEELAVRNITNASRSTQRQVHEQLSPVVRSIITGSNAGYRIADGVEFDPLNHDLANTASFYQPGTVVLTDVETLHTSNPTDDVWHSNMLLGNTEPLKILSKPRQSLLDQSVQVEQAQLLPFASMVLTSATAEYSRFIDLVCLVPGARGQLTALGTSFVVLSPQGSHADIFRSKVSPALSLTTHVGQTAKLSMPDASAVYARTRSVEVCDTDLNLGTKDSARRLLGRFALRRSTSFAFGA